MDFFVSVLDYLNKEKEMVGFVKHLGEQLVAALLKGPAVGQLAV
jgi:hypothetical protein